MIALNRPLLASVVVLPNIFLSFVAVAWICVGIIGLFWGSTAGEASDVNIGVTLFVLGVVTLGSSIVLSVCVMVWATRLQAAQRKGGTVTVFGVIGNW